MQIDAIAVCATDIEILRHGVPAMIDGDLPFNKGFTPGHEYAVNDVNTMVHIPDDMSDAEAALVVTAGSAIYGLDVMGRIVAGEGVAVIGPGPHLLASPHRPAETSLSGGCCDGV